MSLTRSLDDVEIRVLGALLEKEQTTPDHYPLTVSALLAACNQKTAREPVTELSETEVVEALDALRADVLAWRIEGARAERWEHRLDRRWHLKLASKALMTLLMLRGPQTPGELKTRSERLHRFDSVREVEATLEKLSQGGDDALAVELPRGPGQRESRWTHRVGTAEPWTADAPAEDSSAAPRSAPRSAPPSASDREPRSPQSSSSRSSLEARVTALEKALADLEREHLALRRRLGDLD